MHYELPNKWDILWNKFQGSKLAQSTFYNECLGESSDLGAKLLTITDIKSASNPDIPKDISSLSSQQYLSQFSQLSMGVDWGGQTAPIGRNKAAHMAEGSAGATSFTTIAIVGHRIDGKQQCIFAYRFPLAVNHLEEIKYIMQLFNQFKCRLFAHDFGGSGATRETLIVQAGMNPNNIMPILYTGNSTKNYIVFHAANDTQPRNYWSAHKSRSLMTVCMALKEKLILLPDYEHYKDITGDLLALMENKIERPGSSDVLTIVRQPKMHDDFSHSLNYACMANWHSTGSWPRFPGVLSYGHDYGNKEYTNT